MKYAKLLWELFGVAHRDWDTSLQYEDFLWMKAAADQHVAAEQRHAQQMRGA